MGNKRLGIIGGMGPKATAVFYDRLIDMTEAQKDQDHMDIVISNHATLPDRTATILAGEGERFLQAIRSDFALMEFAGVANIAIPCNTSHYFYDDLQAMTSIPIINMVEETIRTVHTALGEGARIGLLATNGTVQSGVYATYAKRYGLQLYIPDAVLQQKVMHMIYQYVKGAGTVDGTELETLVMKLVHDHACDGVIIGCTELSILPLHQDIARHCYDAMDILVQQAIVRSGKRIKRGKE